MKKANKLVKKLINIDKKEKKKSFRKKNDISKKHISMKKKKKKSFNKQLLLLTTIDNHNNKDVVQKIERLLKLGGLLNKPINAKILLFLMKNNVSYISELSTVLTVSKGSLFYFLRDLNHEGMVKAIDPKKDTEAMRIIHLKGKFNITTPKKIIKPYKLSYNFNNDFEPYFNIIEKHIQEKLSPKDFNKIINFKRQEFLLQQKLTRNERAKLRRKLKLKKKQSRSKKKSLEIYKGVKLEILKHDLNFEQAIALFNSKIRRYSSQFLKDEREAWRRIVIMYGEDKINERWKLFKNSWKNDKELKKLL